MDFVIRPQSKVDPEEVRARAKQASHDQQRMKVGVPFFLDSVICDCFNPFLWLFKQ